MPVQTTPSDLARVVLNMTYGDLMEVCGLLADMVAKNNGARPEHTETPQDFASLLHDWADAQGDEDE